MRGRTRLVTLERLAGHPPWPASAPLALVNADDPEASMPDVADVHVYLLGHDLGSVRDLLRELAGRVLEAERAGWGAARRVQERDHNEERPALESTAAGRKDAP